MKPYFAIPLAALACTCVPAQSATCRSEAAAVLGSQYGYNRDKAAAVENEKRESASSDVVGKCIGGITSILVVPTFPSLANIFSQAADKVCHVASEKIREAATLPTPGIPGFPTTAIPIPIIPPATQTVAAPAGDFWSRIWR